jgi:hypothetical protein
MEHYCGKHPEDIFFIACLKAGLTLREIISLSVAGPNEILGKIIAEGQ